MAVFPPLQAEADTAFLTEREKEDVLTVSSYCFCLCNLHRTLKHTLSDSADVVRS